jgi:hypothetical protein
METRPKGTRVGQVRDRNDDRRPPDLPRGPVAIILLLLTIAVLLSGCGGEEEARTEPVTASAEGDTASDMGAEAAETFLREVPEDARVVSVGESFQAASYSVTVASFGELALERVGEPEGGFRWLGVDVIVANTSGEALTIDTYPYDLDGVWVAADGESYSGWLVTGLGQGATSSGFFSPGVETLLTYGYEVRETDRDLTFVMESLVPEAPSVAVPLAD